MHLATEKYVDLGLFLKSIRIILIFSSSLNKYISFPLKSIALI